MDLSCRVCGTFRLIESIDLGDMPIAHKLLRSPEDEESSYHLVIHYCQNCGLIQICNPITPDLLYCDYNYNFSSWKQEPHMDDEIETILRYSKSKVFFEIGCNDGKFMESLKKKGANIIVGVDPNPVAIKIAKERGLDVYKSMLNKDICMKTIEKYGKFETVIARQVLEHLPDIKGFFKCVETLLDEDGALFVDIPDFETALAMGDCSLIWEEHVNYFTEAVLKNTLLRFGYQPLSISRYDFSGGTIAALAKRTRVNNDLSDNVVYDKAYEFSKKVENYKELLIKTFLKYRSKGFLIVLYGVGCRACTVTNGLKLGQYIDFAIDDQIERQNKYMPGSKLHIRSPQVLKDYSGPAQED